MSTQSDFADVSIVITCFNYGKYVSAAVESALGQSVKPREVIVIDDGSTDDSVQVLRQFGDRVQLFTKPNTGVVDTKNMGLRFAVGQWVIFLDADDVLDRTYVEKTTSVAIHYGADLVYTDLKFIGAQSGRVSSRRFSRLALARNNYIHNSALMEKTLVRRVGGYKMAMSAGFEDWELYITLAEHGARGRRVAEPLLQYRRHEEAGRDASALSHRRELIQTIRELHPASYSRRRRWLGLGLAGICFLFRRLAERKS